MFELCGKIKCTCGHDLIVNYFNGAYKEQLSDLIALMKPGGQNQVFLHLSIKIDKLGC